MKNNQKTTEQLLNEIDKLNNTIADLKKSESKHKQAEQELRIERGNLKNIFEAMEDGVYIVNQQYDIQYMNAVLTKDFGIYAGRKCYEYFHDRKEVCTWCKNPDVFAGKTVRWEWTSSKNGKTYDLIDTPLKNSDGSISKLEIFRDITEQKQAEEEIKKKSEDLALINSLNEASIKGLNFHEMINILAKGTKKIFSCTGAAVYLLSENKDYLHLQNLNISSTIVKWIEKIINKDLKIFSIKIPLKDNGLYAKVLQSGKPQLVNDPQTLQLLMAEFTDNKILKKLIPKIFGMLDIQSVINVPLISEGESIGLIDISCNKPFSKEVARRLQIIVNHFTSIINSIKIKEELRKNELKYRLIADYTYDWVYWINPEGEYIYLSSACEKISGYKIEEFISNPNVLYDLVRPDYFDKVYKHYHDENNKDTPVYRMDFPIIARNGNEIWLEHNCSPMFDADGNYLGRRGNNRDITKRKLMEKKLISRNRELETWAEVTTDRELKMLDLKKEINELLEKSDKKPKYKIII